MKRLLIPLIKAISTVAAETVTGLNDSPTIDFLEQLLLLKKLNL